MSQRKNDPKIPSQSSALLMVSPSELTVCNFLGISESNLPSVLTVPTSEHGENLLQDEGDMDSFVGESASSQIAHQTESNKSHKISNNFQTFNNQSTLTQNNFSSVSPLPSVPPISSTMPPPPISTTNHSQYRIQTKFQHASHPESYFQPQYLSQNQQKFNPLLQQQQQFYSSQPSSFPNQPNSQSQTSISLFDTKNQSFQYTALNYHWFFSTVSSENKQIWLPFSHLDSNNLEKAFTSISSSCQSVRVEGGRYDVDISNRKKISVYWEKEREEGEVRRCLWFFRPEGETNFVPYDEKFAAGLEEMYKSTINTCDFHKKLVFPSGETIVIHGPSTFVCYPSALQPDQWGNVMGDCRPQVLRRGINEFENVPKDEEERIDHLVFVVSGPMTTLQQDGRQFIQYVSEMRKTSGQMLSEHFSRGPQEEPLGRVEFLPILWQFQTSNHDFRQIYSKLGNLKPKGVLKLRDLTTHLLSDLLTFLSPSHAQETVISVSDNLNKTYKLFKERHQGPPPKVSIIAQGIGCLIVYDLLEGQKDNNGKNDNETILNNNKINNINLKNDIENNNKTNSINNDNTELEKNKNNKEKKEDKLEEVLEKLNLLEFQETFKKEKIDLPSLFLLDDNDIKELGLPLGPRKKIFGYIKENTNKNNDNDNDDNNNNNNNNNNTINYNNSNNNNNNNNHNNNNSKIYKNKISTGAIYENLQFSFKKKLSSSNLVNNKNIQNIGETNKEGEEQQEQSIQQLKGVDQQVLSFPKLLFQPSNLFTLGSPLALLLALRGITCLGEDFRLPSCPGFFNIFHPYDPLAYRMEPLVLPQVPLKPVLVPHHKGRKRLHLELKESLTRIGYDIKQRIMESVKSTWRAINNLAYGVKEDEKVGEEEVDREVSSVLSQMQKDADEAGSVMTPSVADDSDMPIGNLNQGRRVDFVLQERALEIFNEYLTASSSPSSYWHSEDTLLMIVKELYVLEGVFPMKTAMPILPSQPGFPINPPPRSGFLKYHPPLPPSSSIYPPPPPPPLPSSTYPSSSSVSSTPLNYPLSYSSYLPPPPNSNLTSSHWNSSQSAPPPPYYYQSPAFPSSHQHPSSFPIDSQTQPTTNQQPAGPPPLSGFVKL